MKNIILNTERKESLTYVLFDEDNKRVVAVLIDVKHNEDVTDRVSFAIQEDVIAQSVEITEVSGEFDITVKANVTEEGFAGEVLNKIKKEVEEESLTLI